MCAICDDTGWKPVTVDGVRRVVRCDCWQSEHTRRLIEDHPDLTALFAYNDRVALGALVALWRAGRRVPEDVSVVGYQDLPFAAYQIPPLTTVRIPIPRIAELATGLLFQALAGEETPEREVMVRPELVIRESTAPPARATTWPPRPGMRILSPLKSALVLIFFLN